MNRSVLSLFACASLALAMPLAACSSDTEGGGTSSGGASSGGTSSGGASSSGGSSSFKSCQPPDSWCTEAEMQPYVECATSKCDAEYKKCYGDAFMSGTFGGPCGEWIGCFQACECDDTACQQACGTPPEACNTCSTELSQCITSQCTLPECATGGGGGETKTCDELKACCDAITDETTKTQCTGTYDAVKDSGDVTCNAAYAGYAQHCE